jgi:tripeptide aminopeptidase
MNKIVDQLIELLSIDSPSGEETKIAQLLLEKLQSYELNGEVDPAGNVICHVPGVGEPILLLAHMDNVPPCKNVRPIIADGVVRSDGSTVLGADDKAGIAIILQILDDIVASEEPHVPIEIVFTVQEETGMKGVKNLDISRLNARQAICLDGSGASNSIVLTSPTSVNITVEIKGRAAFPGLSEHEGIDAIKIAAEAISAFPTGRVNESTIVNIGTIRGGEAVNVVPEYVEFKGTIRSLQSDLLDRQIQLMKAVIQDAAKRHGGKSEVTIEENYPGYSHSSEFNLIQKISRAMEKHEVKPAFVQRWGGTDGNILNSMGIQTVAVGVGYMDHHSTSEYLKISEMIRCYQIIREVLRANTLSLVD